MRVAVAGGTGVVGALVVEQLAAAGHEAVVLARSRGVDLTTGEGLDAALSGCRAVVDTSGTASVTRKGATSFFEAAALHLQESGERAGVEHLVVLSIVGSDRVDLGHYLGKRRQEEIAATGTLPWTVLRTTQFHEFVAQVMSRASGPLLLVPRMRIQPVAAREVAAALVDAVEQDPGGLAVPLAGPQEHELVDLARERLRVRGQRRLLVPVKLPGATGTAMATGALLPTGQRRLGRQTFAEHLAASP